MTLLKNILVAACIGLVSVFARADSAQELALSDLTRIADRIDVVRCVAMAGRWQGKNIVTDNRLLVLQNIKGAAYAQQFTLLTLGGTASHPKLKVPVKMVVPGGAALNLDKEFLLFSKHMPNGDYQLVGFSQGLFSVETDANTGKRSIPIGYKLLTNQSDTQSTILGPTPTLLTPDGAQVTIRSIYLDEMIERIQKLL